MNLHKHKQEFEDLITIVANYIRIPIDAVRRDYYIVLIMQNLQNSEYAEKCVFKGGTSLSKCYPGSINRFSEDIDLTFMPAEDINNKKYSQKKVLLINCMSESIKTFINHFIEKELYDQLVITKSIHYYEIEEENLDQYDLILSTAPIHRQLPIPVISVNYIMSQDDIIRIKSYLSYLFNDEQMLYYFHPSFYKTHVPVKTLKGLATSFYQSIKSVYRLNDSKKNDMMNKNICSVHTFENQIGLLRLSRPLNSNNIISIIVLEEPMKVENQTFNIAILFSCTDNQNIMYNTLFSTLKNISKNKDDLNRLSSHISYTEFLSIILKNK